MMSKQRGALCLFALALPVPAADIGGWMEQQQQQSRAAASPRNDDCPEILRLAALAPREAENAAAHYYAAGLCYLASEKIARDKTAAAAWLAKAAELDHPLARRALLALRDESAPPLHPAGWHCHELGLGRRLCHGGAAPQ
jgi:TPR repeat protein